MQHLIQGPLRIDTAMGGLMADHDGADTVEWSLGCERRPARDGVLAQRRPAAAQPGARRGLGVLRRLMPCIPAKKGGPQASFVMKPINSSGSPE